MSSIKACFTQLWSYRELARNLILRDLRLQNGGTMRGAVAVALQPLVVAVVYMIGLRAIAGSPVPNYGLFLAVGAVHWQLSCDILLRSCRAVTGNAGLVGRAWFPRAILPLASVLAELYKFGLTLILFLALVVALGGGLWLGGLLVYGVALGLHILLLTGAAFLCASVQVFCDDFQELLAVVLRVGFWLSPVLYSLEMASPTMGIWLQGFNPFVPILEIARALFYDLSLPQAHYWLLLGLWTALFVTLGIVTFLKLQGRFADEL